MIKLSDKAISEIRASTVLKGKLQTCLNISSNTLYTWLSKKSPKLTNISAIEAIREATGMTDEEILQR